MSQARVTISIPESLLARVDARAKAAGKTRSAVVEQWLRAGARAATDDDLARELEEYYATPDEDGAAIARASLDAARRLDIDGAGRPASRRAPGRVTPARSRA